MPDDLISIRMRLLGGRETASELSRVDRELGGIDSTTARVTTTTNTAGKSTSRFRSTLGGLGSAIKYSAIPGLALLGYGVTSSVNAYREARKIGEQTNAVIKSTGKVANVTADDVASLANTLSLKTGVDDEEIQAGANMLLTFKNIRNEVGKGNNIFDQGVAVINDMSSALGQDMKSSAIQLGKALNDPVLGITALSRVGVTFTEKTKKQIATLVKQGNTLKAQKIILKELTSEFGGSARAQHDSVDRLGVAWENLQEVLGKAVYPILQDVTQWLTKALRQAEHGKGPLIDLKNWFSDAGDKIDYAADKLGDFLRPMKWLLDHADDLPDFISGATPRTLTPAEQNFVDDIRPHGAAPAAPTGGHAQNKLQRAPITAAPKAPTGNAGAHGSGKRQLRVPVMLPNGKMIAEAVVDEAEIAQAWG